MTSYDLTIIGLGYVGLPLAEQAVKCGLMVAGLELNAAVVELLMRGKSHIDDIDDAAVQQMVDTGFIATTDPEVIARSAAVVICVPTPLNDDGGPDLQAVISAAATVRDYLRPGCIVVLESTTYPGTTDDVIRPVLEESGLVAGQDFDLAFSPERIDPGNAIYGVANTPKVVGGVNHRSTETAAALYERFVDRVVRTKGTKEAEMAKLLENTYRHVNIALVNEMAIFCHDLGIDLWEAIDAARTKPFGFQAFYPGPGVGGHCIPIDPNYLSYKVRTLGYPFRFVELAQEISARMPAYVVSRSMLALNRQGKAMSGAKVLLLGVTYKKNISDERESPAKPLGRRLLDLGADLSYSDPYVAEWRLGKTLVEREKDAAAAAAHADLVIILQDHEQIDLAGVQRAAVSILDTRGCLRGDNVERL